MLRRLLERYEDWRYGPLKTEYKRASIDYPIIVAEQRFKIHTCTRVVGRCRQPDEILYTGGVMIVAWPKEYDGVLANTTEADRFVEDDENLANKIRLHVLIMQLLKEGDPAFLEN